MKKLLSISLTSTILGASAMAQYLPTPAQVHIYQSGFAVIQESRNLELQEGFNQLSLHNLPSRLIPDSVLIMDDPTALLAKPEHKDSFTILKQSFEPASLDNIYLRKHFLGKEVKLISRLEENPAIQTGTIISSTPFVIRLDNHILTEQALRSFDIMYPNPENMLDFKPSLSLDAQSKVSGTLPISLQYQTGSFSWSAAYVGLLNEDQSQLSLQSIATITNIEYQNFDNMKVTLIAGDIKPPAQPVAPRKKMMAMMDSEAYYEVKTEAPRNDALGHVQLFALQPLVSLDGDQSASYPFLPEVDLALDEELIVDFTSYEHQQRGFINTRPYRILTFSNETGYALPSGNIKIYEQHKDDTSYFTGEMQLNNTAKNEEVKLSMGQAYNIKAERKMLNFKDFMFSRSKNLSYEVTLSNARDREVTVLVNENTPPDAKVSKPSHPYEKIEATKHQFTVTIPAGGEAVVTYDVSL